jgi:PhnB protein
MAPRISTYLNFKDTALEAMTFYQSVFGGELTKSTFGEFGMQVEPGEEGKIMHSQLVSEGVVRIMAADTPNYMGYTPGFANFSVAIFGSKDQDAELHGYFDKLAEGGSIDQPLVEAPWGDSFGMLTDRFGIAWMVNIGESGT